MSNSKLDDCFLNRIPVFLAPMAGVTDAPFRNIVSEFGVSAVVSEMVSSEALVRNSRKTFQRLASSKGDVLKIVQILGDDPEHMAESAAINEESGAEAIDINMGCPVRKIVSNNTGAALMNDEDLAERIVRKIVEAVKIPVTVKMRLGWDNNSINFASLAKKCEDAGAQMITVHCRTRSQMYSGKADWARIKELRRILKIPYLCNGDIYSPEDAKAALKESEAYGVMVGRRALGNPWFPHQIFCTLNNLTVPAIPSLPQQLEIIMRHFNMTCDFYGTGHGIRMFRKHFCWYSTGMSNASKFREAINRADDISLIKEYAQDFYQDHFRVTMPEGQE